MNTSDRHGGAARSAYRLHLGLKHAGLDSGMFVQDKEGTDSDVYGAGGKSAKLVAKLRPYVDRIPAGVLYREREHNFTPAIVPGRAIGRINALQPDIVHLHWLGKGFIRLGALKRLKPGPVVWTLHDSWAFTGGCHIPYSCTRYRERCGRCPVLDSGRDYDLSRWVWNRKSRVLGDLDLTVVTPSRWLGDCARRSGLFRDTRVEVIPNGIDVGMYKPLDQGFCRKALSLPAGKKIVMFGAMYSTSDRNKGFDYLVSALRKIAATPLRDEVVAVVIGADAPDDGVDVGLDIRFLGQLNDDTSLAVAYSAADLFVAPSKQENLPNMVMEAMACGVPCVAFDIGGMPDMIEHRKTGYLARPYEPEDLAEGMRWIIADREVKRGLSMTAREKIVANFSENLVAERYRSLYNEILKDRKACQS
ncbi:MAG: glycosyltransferase family 4 protein [Thiogranum sp.]